MEAIRVRKGLVTNRQIHCISMISYFFPPPHLSLAPLLLLLALPFVTILAVSFHVELAATMELILTPGIYSFPNHIKLHRFCGVLPTKSLFKLGFLCLSCFIPLSSIKRPCPISKDHDMQCILLVVFLFPRYFLTLEVRAMNKMV